MVNENLINLINKKPVELVQELKDYEIKKSPLSVAARAKVIKKYGSDYQSLRATINNPSYGPGIDGADCYKYCYYCKKNVSVSSSSNSYCPQCGTAFGTVSKKTTGLQKLNSDAGQRVINNYGDRVERSGGEVKVKIGDEDVEITYKRN
jgi:hypothetical protein